MSPRSFVVSCLTVTSVALVAAQTSPRPAARPAAPAPVARVSSTNAVVATDASVRALLDEHCVRCHSARLKSGGVALDGSDLTDLVANPGPWERAVRKTRAGMMPPAGLPRPDPAVREALSAGLEGELDRTPAVQYAAARPASAQSHRIRRTRFATCWRWRSMPRKFLPTDDSTRGFDNMAGTLVMSPPLLEAYLSAAGKSAVWPSATSARRRRPCTACPRTPRRTITSKGCRSARAAACSSAPVPRRRRVHAQGHPGQQAATWVTPRRFGEVAGEKLEVFWTASACSCSTGTRRWPARAARRRRCACRSKAGLHTVGVTFLATQYAPLNDLNQRFLRSTIETGGLPGFTFFPHVGSVRIDGPYNANGARGTRQAAARSSCAGPTEPSDEEPVPETIVSTLARAPTGVP